MNNFIEHKRDLNEHDEFYLLRLFKPVFVSAGIVLALVIILGLFILI